MNLLMLRTYIKYATRHITSTASSRKILLENLSSSRSLIRVSGEQVEPFLQGLITNDINHVSKDSATRSMFTMFLNKAGRILYDAIIYKRPEENTFLIECDASVDEQLKAHLQLFRVRKKIDIDLVRNDLSVWAAFNENSVSFEKSDSLPDTIYSYSDPRLKLIGTRLIVPIAYTENEIAQALESTQFEKSTDFSYAEHRYQLGVGEGVNELPPEKCFPFEANCDYMHGISFHKGCYLGQEFTARTYHTGVIRKRLMPIKLSVEISSKDLTPDNILATAILTETGQAAGKLRGFKKKWALGLLKIDVATKCDSLQIKDVKATTFKPDWWPTEAPKQTK